MKDIVTLFSNSKKQISSLTDTGRGSQISMCLKKVEKIAKKSVHSASFIVLGYIHEIFEVPLYHGLREPDFAQVD